MMIATLVTAVNTSGTPALATRMTVAMTPISTAGMTGVLRTGSIRASVAPAGSALSRAMANISLIAAVCTASAHTVTAMVIEIRKTVPSVPPITCSRMQLAAAGLLAQGRVGQVGRGEYAEQQDQPPDDERGDHRAQDRGGRGAPRVHRLLAERAGGVEAVHHVGRGQRGDQEDAEVTARFAVAEATGVEQHRGRVDDVEPEDDDDQHRRDELDEHPGAVDLGHQPHATALITVVKMMSTTPSSTPLTAASPPSAASRPAGTPTRSAAAPIGRPAPPRRW